MQRDPRHDHSFQIPDPAVAADACTRCHEDRTDLGEAYRAWYGEPDPTRADRAAIVERARRGEEQPLQPVFDLLASERPAWRATAASVLEAYLTDEQGRAALVGALDDPDGHVRFAAAGALAPAGTLPEIEAALKKKLEDPLRAVRVQASRGLRTTGVPLPDYEAYLDYNAEQPAALHERGTWWLERGQPARAVKVLREAVEIDPTSPMLRDSLAVALSVYGRSDQAAVELREAVRLAPDDAELAYRLGLAEAGAGSFEAAVAALEQAVAVSPEHERAWYNLGLLHAKLSRPDEAVSALERAVAAAPDSAEIRYGLASTLHQQGQTAEARRAAKEVLRLDPSHQGARVLLGQ